ncbi:MAG: 8-oxo-dGTP diphosphatase [Ruminococcaceae bacterium]|nr:8-oxo-dGTP diphosphatase [Oscillospiraceae bacterium]
MRNTTLCYIEKDGCYLMLHRINKENDLNRDKWIGIGGGFEENESPEECAAREILEETGLTVRSMRYCGIVTFVSDEYEGEYMHLFRTDDFEGELCDCDEGVLTWVPKEKINDLPQWEGDRIFYDLVEKNAPFFSLKLTYTKEVLTEAVLDGKKIR